MEVYMYSEEALLISFALGLSLIIGGILYYYFCKSDVPVHQEAARKLRTTPEAITLQHEYDTLHYAIQSPDAVADVFFEKNVIDFYVKERVQLHSRTIYEKCGILLSAIERRVHADPSQFYILIDVLQKEPSAERMAQRLLTSLETNSKQSECQHPSSVISSRQRTGLVFIAVLVLAVLGLQQLTSLSLPLCSVIIITGSSIVFLWKYTTSLSHKKTSDTTPDVPVVTVVGEEQSMPCQQETRIVKTSPTMLRYTGPCANSRFHRTQRFYIEHILQNNVGMVNKVTKQIVEGRIISVDIKAVALSYQALSKMNIEGQLDDADALFRSALEKARSPECENSLILEGRILRHYASLYRIKGDYDRALDCVRGAKDKLFTTVPSHERAGVIFEEIHLRQCCSVPDASRESIEKDYELLLGHADYIEEYEKPALCIFLTRKAAFHLRSSQIKDDLPPEENRPTSDDIQKAELCLKGVHLDMLPSHINYYTAEYYVAQSDLHMWKQQYPEAIVYARKAKHQFAQGNITNEKSCTPSLRLKLLERLQAQEDLDKILA